MGSSEEPTSAADRSHVASARPVPDHEVERFFPRGRDEYSDRKRREIRRQYGYLRGFFRMRSSRYADLQRWLNQAHVGENFDTYLARGVRYAVVAALLAALVGQVIAARLSVDAIAVAVEAPAWVPPSVATALSRAGGPLVHGLLVGGGAAVAAAATYWGHYHYPRLLVDSRRRNINLLLPHATVYMYALSYGGLRPLRVLEELAAAEDTYGEVAAEMGLIVREVEVFGNDLVTAVQNARNTTPNENLEQFLDDMLGVLDSGGDLTNFLAEQTRTYRSKAEAEQSEFLEMLEVVSELFVVAFVAAPLFLVVTLVLIGMMGADAIPMTTALVYGVLPVGMVGFLVLVHYLSLPFSTVHGVDTRLGPDDEAVAPSPAAAAAERYDRYRLHAIRGLAADLLGDPVGTLRSHTPLLSLVVTLPAAAGLVVAVVASEPGDAGALYAADPVGATTALVVAPLVVVAAPLSLLYELRRRRTTHIARRFPDTLNLLASANQMGIPLTEALDLVSRWSDGVIATELRKTHNDVQWSHDVQSALLGLGDRLGVPQIKRTAKLLATGTYSTSDLSTVLSVAAEDTRTRYELERSRREEMQVYVLIVGIGFFVYLGVVVLLDLNYLTPVAQLSEQAASVEAASANAAPAMAVTEVPVQRYRTLFFHSALIQAAGSGLLAGKLAENDLLAGLKYAVVLVVAAAAVFTVV